MSFIYGERNNRKVYRKFKSNKYYNKKEKNRIQKETSKFSKILKFHIDVLQLDRINLNGV